MLAEYSEKQVASECNLDVYRSGRIALSDPYLVATLIYAITLYEQHGFRRHHVRGTKQSIELQRHEIPQTLM